MHLLQVRKLREEEIPDKPREFLETMRELFGQGAGILEKMIVRELKKTFNITLGDGLMEVLDLVKQSRGITRTAPVTTSKASRQAGTHPALGNMK